MSIYKKKSFDSRINPWDIFIIFSVLAMLLTIGMNLNRSSTITEPVPARLEITVEKIKGTAGIDNILLLDGRFKCRIYSIEEQTLSVICEGQIVEGAFFIDGVKAMCRALPISLVADGFYAQGYIRKLFFTS